MKMKTGGEVAGFDESEVRRAAALFLSPDGWHEITTLPARGANLKWVVGGDIDAVASHCREMAYKTWQQGTYWVLGVGADSQPCNASDEHIAQRRWLFLDFDAHPADGGNATDDERDEAKDTMQRCRDWLVNEMGWPAPAVIDSGNGFYLLFRLEPIAADNVSKAAVERATHKIAAVYGLKVDAKVTNASRLSRVPGTINRRGPELPGRPRRMCRIVEEGSGALTWAALLEMAGPDAAAGAETPKRESSFKRKATGGEPGGYGAKALAEEIAKLAGASKGERNNTLFAVAAALYELAEGGELTFMEVDEALWSAIRSIGLDGDDERKTTEGTLRSARKAAAKNPRKAPERDTPKAGKKKAKDEEPKTSTEDWSLDRDSVTYAASEVTPREVEWLWKNRVPLGKLTTFAGHGGLGKTFVLCDVTARVTNGTDWPDGEKNGESGDVLFVSGEDDPDDTLVPRLIMLGADLKRVRFLNEPAMAVFTLKHLKLLDKAMSEATNKVRLVVIDPPTAYLGGIDDHKNSELRQLLSPLKDWAGRHKAALIFNTHVNKGGAGKVEAMARVMGSVAWVNAVRAAHMFAKDPDDGEKRVFVPMKNNLGASVKGRAYRIQPRDKLAVVEWLGEVDMTADQAFGGDKSNSKVAGSAKKWLIEKFRERTTWRSDDLMRDRVEAGHSKNAVYEASDMFSPHPVKKSKITGESGNSHWEWSVPPNWPWLTPGYKPPDEKQNSTSKPV